MELEKIIIFGVVVATAVLALMIYLYAIKVYLTMKIRGLRAVGQVVDLKIQRARDFHGQETGAVQQQPVFSFEADGQYITGSPRYMTTNRYRVGEEVDIIYHARKPHVFVTRDEIQQKRPWLGFLLLMLFFGLIIFLFLMSWDSGRMVEDDMNMITAYSLHSWQNVVVKLSD